MSHSTRVTVRPIAIVFALVVGGALAFFAVLVRDPYLRGEISATYAVAAWFGWIVAFGLPFAVATLIGRKTKGWPTSVRLRRIVEALSAATGLVWAVTALQVAQVFGVGPPAPCTKLLSFQSPLVWVMLALTPFIWIVTERIGRAPGETHANDIGSRMPAKGAPSSR